MTFEQGNIIKINDIKNAHFIIVSKNAFIKATGMFHVCPVIKASNPGSLHINVSGQKGFSGTVICEQIKLIDPSARACTKTDHLPYGDIMEVSDALQGVFEYD